MERSRPSSYQMVSCEFIHVVQNIPVTCLLVGALPTLACQADFLDCTKAGVSCSIGRPNDDLEVLTRAQARPLGGSGAACLLSAAHRCHFAGSSGSF